MDDKYFIIRDEILLKYVGVGGDVTIPDGVKYIANSAFFACQDITSVTIPNGVIYIGEYAFSNCFGLSSVFLPNSLKTISDYAFYSCGKLSSITIPTSVITIGSYAFSYSAITDLTIPESVERLKALAFSNCYNLKKVLIKGKLKDVGSKVFARCDNLEKIIMSIPDNSNIFALASTRVVPLYYFDSCLEPESKENTVFYWLCEEDLERCPKYEAYAKNAKTIILKRLIEEERPIAFKNMIEKIGIEFTIDELDEAIENHHCSPSMIALLLDYKRSRFTQQEINAREEEKIAEVFNTSDASTDKNHTAKKSK